MSQNDFNIADQVNAQLLADLNAALQALASLSSGAAAPATTYPYQLWADTTNNLLKIRNSANNGWLTLAYFDTVNDRWELQSNVLQALTVDGVSIKNSAGVIKALLAGPNYELDVVGKGRFSDELTIPEATADTSAVARGQVKNAAPIGVSGVGGPSITNYSITTPTFTAPCDGILIANANLGISAGSSGPTLSISASLGATTSLGSSGVNAAAYIAMTAGQATTLMASGHNNNAGYMLMNVLAFFQPNP